MASRRRRAGPGLRRGTQEQCPQRPETGGTHVAEGSEHLGRACIYTLLEGGGGAEGRAPTAPISAHL